MLQQSHPFLRHPPSGAARVPGHQTFCYSCPNNSFIYMILRKKWKLTKHWV